METEDTPGTVDQLRENFKEECVLVALDKASGYPDGDEPDVLILDEDTGRIYRVLDATRGSPDSGWFILALAGPNPQDDYERQHRIHDSDTHRVLVTHLKNVQEMGV